MVKENHKGSNNIQNLNDRESIFKKNVQKAKGILIKNGKWEKENK